MEVMMKVKLESRTTKAGKGFWSGSLYYRDSWYNVALFERAGHWAPKFSKRVDNDFVNFDLPLVLNDFDETGATFDEVDGSDPVAMEVKELREIVMTLKGRVDILEEQLKASGETVSPVEDYSGPVPF
jgi:hypothetical protein